MRKLPAPSIPATPPSAGGVSALEKELGVPLLRRSNRLLGLTPAGELLLHEGKALLAAADSLCEKVKEQT